MLHWKCGATDSEFLPVDVDFGNVSSQHSCDFNLHMCKHFKQTRCTGKLTLTQTHTHAIAAAAAAAWLPSKWFVSRHPSSSAGLNKSHQAGSDSSYVDRMPNVIWRLGEHRIGPNGASPCDVILSLDESLTRSRTCAPSARNSQKRGLTRSARLTYYPSSAKPGPSVRNRHTPLRLFVLFFMFHFPSACLESLLSLRSLSCIHA